MRRRIVALAAIVGSAQGLAPIVVITGATDGIGRRTARKLARVDGAHLLVCGRADASSAGAALVEELLADGASDAEYFRADLSEPAAVAALAAGLLRATDRIDVLVNNAGVFDPTPRTNSRGTDVTWAVNVAAPHLLTTSLRAALTGGRVVTTSSMSQCSPPLDLESCARPAEYSAHRQYSVSKLADRLLAAGFADVLDDVESVSMDPGTVNTKMLLAGWGPCGMAVDAADKTYLRATQPLPAGWPNGSYDGAPSDPGQVRELFGFLEAEADGPAPA